MAANPRSGGRYQCETPIVRFASPDPTTTDTHHARRLLHATATYCHRPAAHIPAALSHAASANDTSMD